MNEPAPVRPLDIALMFLLGAIWGASFLFMRIAVKEFGPVPLIEVRVLFGGVFLLIVAVARGKQRELLQAPLKMAFVGATNSALPYTMFAWGLKLLSAGVGSVINATAPFFGALLGVFFLGEHLTSRKWVGLAIGFLGVLVLAASNHKLEGSLLGIIACLLAALLYSIAAHFTRRQLQGVSALAIATSSQLSAAILLAPLAIVYWPAQTPGMSSWLAAAALGILCTGAALLIYFDLLHNIGATRAISTGYLIPLFGVLWGWLFLNETITPWILLGAACILTGLFVFTRPR